MKNLRFICAQPDNLYYAWQIEVMLNNFIEMGVNPNNIDVVSTKNNNKESDEFRKLANKYNDVRFFFYEDTRKNKNYISSIRPNILKQHFKKHLYLKNEIIFYHDCDILLTNPINEWLCCAIYNDNNWHGSDCRWYIGHDYIISKGEDVLDKMCDIMSIKSDVLKENELNSIGAQYIMKGLTHYFWERVEKDSEILFKEITELNNKKKLENPEYHELQIWCADMWAVLWNGWKMGYNTICNPKLEFTWATGTKEEFYKNNIFHNAGIVNSDTNRFYKSDYMHKLPYNVELDILENTASLEYFNKVQKVGKNSILI
jgi:hypothetical protein